MNGKHPMVDGFYQNCTHAQWNILSSNVSIYIHIYILIVHINLYLIYFTLNINKFKSTAYKSKINLVEAFLIRKK